MNWKEISEKYPLSLENLEEWSSMEFMEDRFGQSWLSQEMCGTCREYLNERDLYDFFDEKGIICNVGCSKRQSWGWCIDIGDGFPLFAGGNGYPYLSRTQTEESMFTKAFELLERRLNDDTGE